jgi:hypothetical protein
MNNMDFSGFVFKIALLLGVVHFSLTQQGLDDSCGGIRGFVCNEQSGLVCNPLTGRCDCGPLGMIYNIRDRICQVSVGLQCDSTSNLKCVEDASCVQVAGQQRPECACDEGFEGVPARSCDGVRIDVAEDGTPFPRICCPISSTED